MTFFFFRLTPYLTEAVVNTYEYASPLVTIKQGLGKIVKGNYKIIHTINLDDYERVVNTIRPIVQYEISKTGALVPQLEHQHLQIDKLLDQLRVRKPTKNKRSINWIGSAWKWLAGNPDATDWDTILAKTNDLTGNSNTQYTVNQYLIKTTNKILDGYNRIIDEIDTNNTDRYEQTLFNKLGLIKAEIAQIVMATQLAKKGIVHSQLLNKADITNILSRTETLPFKNELQALDYAEPSMIVKGSLLLYVISLPQTGDTLFNNILIRSTIKNNKKIYLNFTNLFLSQSEKYGILGNCLIIGEVTICKRNQLQKLEQSHCIVQALTGGKALCDYQFQNQPIVELIADGTIFLSNFKEKLTYGNTSQNLNGTYIINFFNETITLGNVSYTNWQTTSYQILPPILQGNLTEKEVKLDLQYLHQLHLTNVKRLEHISLRNVMSISNSSIAIFLALSLFLVLHFWYRPAVRNKSFQIPPLDLPPISINYPEKLSAAR